jgi:hypothetical protein
MLLSGLREVEIYSETDDKTIFLSDVEFSDGVAVLPIILDTLGTNRLHIYIEGVSYSSLISLEVLFLEFAGGSGTEDDPYLIADAEDLNNVRYNLTAHYKKVNTSLVVWL